MTTTLTPRLLRDASHLIGSEQYMCCAISEAVALLNPHATLCRRAQPARVAFESILKQHSITLSGCLVHPHFPDDCLSPSDPIMRHLRFDFMQLLACAMESGDETA